MNDEKQKIAIEEFQKNNRSPLRQIALVTMGLIVLAWFGTGMWEGDWLDIVFSTDWVRLHSARWLYERHLFVIYACAFVAWWWVYLKSRKLDDEPADATRRHVRTLRRLLGECSVQWRSAEKTEQSNQKLDEVESNFRNKAKSSMTSIAILVAVSALELQELSRLLAPLLEKQSPAEISWQVAILLLSLAFAMTAFIAYIVSADALDVIFNNFVDDVSRHRITHYYYQRTINPRYAALISLIASFILLIAYYSPLVASVAIGLFFAIGYSHWFPDFGKEQISKYDLALRRLTKVVLVLFPAVPMYLGWHC